MRAGLITIVISWAGGFTRRKQLSPSPLPGTTPLRAPLGAGRDTAGGDAGGRRAVTPDDLLPQAVTPDDLSPRAVTGGWAGEGSAVELAPQANLLRVCLSLDFLSCSTSF